MLTKSININLSEDDYERIMIICGKCNRTIEQIVTSFINDLIGNYKSDIDAEMMINKWYEHRYGYINESLLRFLLDNYGNYYLVNEFINESKKVSIEDVGHEYYHIISEYKEKNPYTDIDKSIIKINDWLTDYNSIFKTGECENVEPEVAELEEEL